MLAFISKVLSALVQQRSRGLRQARLVTRTDARIHLKGPVSVGTAEVAGLRQARLVTRTDARIHLKGPVSVGTAEVVGTETSKASHED